MGQESIVAGFRQYMPVIERFGDFRAAGQFVQFRCPFGERHKNGDRSWSGLMWRGDAKGELVARCQGCGAGWKELVEWAGLPARAWFKDGVQNTHTNRRRAMSNVVAEYMYTDRKGQFIAKKLRWEPGFDGGRSKDFTWRRPMPDWPQGEPPPWVNGLNAGWYYPQGSGQSLVYKPTADKTVQGAIELEACRVGLYRIHDLLVAKMEMPIFVVEGEGKADLLKGLGFVAVSGPAGKSKWDVLWGSDFQDRRVVVIPDRDVATDGGMVWGHQVAASALYFNVASVRIVELPISELKPNSQGGDIKDWMLRKLERQPDAATATKRGWVVEIVKASHEYSRQPVAVKAA